LVPKVENGRARHAVVQVAERFREAVVSRRLDGVKDGRHGARGQCPEAGFVVVVNAEVQIGGGNVIGRVGRQKGRHPGTASCCFEAHQFPKVGRDG